MSLRLKIIGLLLVASTLPLVVTAYLVYRSGRDALREDARAHLATVADAAAGSVDNFNEHYLAILRALGKLPALDRACGEIAAGRAPAPEAQEAVDGLLASDESIRAISMTEAGGTIRLSTSPEYVGVDISSRSYVEQARASAAPAIGVVVATRYAQPLLMVIYAQALHGGQCLAAIGVRADPLTQRVRSYTGTIGEDSFVVVTDEHGIRIAHGLREDFVLSPSGPLPEDEIDEMVAEKRFGDRTAALLAHVEPEPEQFRRARAADPGSEVFEHDSVANDKRNLSVARRITTAPWTVFVRVPVDTIDEPASALVRRAALVGLAVAGAAFLLGLVLAAAIDRTTVKLGRDVAERTEALVVANTQLSHQREELLAQKEELIAQRDEIARADRMKSEFLHNMSHELRTPLNSVIGFADLLQVTAEDRLSVDEQSHLRDIVSAGRHLLLIINDILDLAKIEAGRVRLSLEPIDAGDLLTGAVAMVQSLAKARRVEVRTTLRASHALRGDPDRMRQVLLNLLSNAIKFSPEGDVVDVRVSDRDGSVVFEVVDRGPGIPAELARELFQPFVQGEGALVKRHQGTGLGLAISKRLIELHGGTIELESKVGQGSTFRVVVPAAGHLAPAPHDGPVIVLVEDAPARGHRARLEAAGYRVVTAPDLSTIADGAAAVVIDVLDAGPRAAELLDAAAKLSATVPVVLLSQEPQVLVPKPIDPEPLRALCRRLIAGDGDRPRILVIDDDPRVVELLGAALGDGYQLIAALTATDGLARAREGHHELHVVDLALPDGSGFDVLDQLAADPATRATPRIVLTALELDAAQLERLRRSAQAIAGKGAVTPEELLLVVDRLVRPKPPASARGKPRILVVDDHDMNRDLARSILERLGYAVVQARDGAEALAIAEEHAPDLILMDLAMPGMDGFTATRKLKAHPELRGIPVIALSALAMKADEDRAREAGVDDFLTKPVDRVALERVVTARVKRA